MHFFFVSTKCARHHHPDNDVVSHPPCAPCPPVFFLIITALVTEINRLPLHICLSCFLPLCCLRFIQSGRDRPRSVHGVGALGARALRPHAARKSGCLGKQLGRPSPEQGNLAGAIFLAHLFFARNVFFFVMVLIVEIHATSGGEHVVVS